MDKLVRGKDSHQISENITEAGTDDGNGGVCEILSSLFAVSAQTG